jgi:glycopeptide antibiotics resistance protein
MWEIIVNFFVMLGGAIMFAVGFAFSLLILAFGVRDVVDSFFNNVGGKSKR